MRVLVIGGGAREHAIVSVLARGAEPGSLLCAPGNPGIARLARTVTCGLSDPDGLVALADREQIDFTVVGPEAPLSLGVADRFAAAGRLLFGPTAAAARLESSKAFAKAFMARHGIPTARFLIVRSPEEALNVVRSNRLGWPLVLKADGLAAGKGVVIAETAEQAEEAVADAMTTRKFGAAGETLVLEECLSGSEVSFFVVSDGVRALPFGSAQDHKRIFDGDRGPNTGGMGAFAPSPLMDEAMTERVMNDIVRPVIGGMAGEGYPFQGFLFVGLMLTAAGPKVIEFNVRLGDPETQAILPLIEEPLLPILESAARGELRQSTVRSSSDCAVGVVIASRGYPESSESGRPIRGIGAAEAIQNVAVYHAGTASRDGGIVTAGGRVLTVTGRGQTFPDAIASAYAGVEQIEFDGMQYRRDIGQKALLETPR
jgi:phosphoribosylamine---glycine ligase